MPDLSFSFMNNLWFVFQAVFHSSFGPIIISCSDPGVSPIGVMRP
jgi:hypothetical protein